MPNLIRVTNSTQAGYRAKAEPGTPEYKTKVAEPIMGAIDQMPVEWRALVHEWGYIGVYHGWRKGVPLERVRAKAEATGGDFDF